MAEDDVRPDQGPRHPDEATPNRGKRRDTLAIEGEATEIRPLGGETLVPGEPTPSDQTPTGEYEAPAPDARVEEPSMASASADLAAPGHSAQAFAAPADALPPRRRSMMPALLGVIGVLLVLLLGAILYTLMNPAGGNEVASLQAREATLTKRVAALEARPEPGAASAALEGRVKALEGSVAGVTKELGETRDKIGALPVAAAAVAGAPDADLPAKLTALDAKTDDLAHQITDLRQQIGAIPKPDMGPVDAKLANLAAGVVALKAGLAAVPKVDLGPLEGKVAALDQRLAPVEAVLSAPKTTKNVTEARQEGSAAESRAAPVAVVSQAIQQALDDGKPFATEVTALTSLGVDPAKLAPLRAVAATGAPTRAALSAGFAAVRDGLVAADAPVQTGTMLDRMMASAQSLVKVRPAGASPGSDPDAVSSRIDADLSTGSFRAALDEWTALPGVSKTASAAWADQLKARVGAEEAARSIGSSAIAALGPSQ